MPGPSSSTRTCSTPRAPSSRLRGRHPVPSLVRLPAPRPDRGARRSPTCPLGRPQRSRRAPSPQVRRRPPSPVQRRPTPTSRPAPTPSRAGSPNRRPTTRRPSSASPTRPAAAASVLLSPVRHRLTPTLRPAPSLSRTGPPNRRPTTRRRSPPGVGPPLPTAPHSRRRCGSRRRGESGDPALAGSAAAGPAGGPVGPGPLRPAARPALAPLQWWASGWRGRHVLGLPHGDRAR